jgi:hypothetical protein
MAEGGQPHEDRRLVRQAACEGVAIGLREHLPGGIGILVKGGALCVLLAILHFGLGLDVATTIVSGGVSGAALAALQRLTSEPADRPQ